MSDVRPDDSGRPVVGQRLRRVAASAWSPRPIALRQVCRGSGRGHCKPAQKLCERLRFVRVIEGEEKMFLFCYFEVYFKRDRF